MIGAVLYQAAKTFCNVFFPGPKYAQHGFAGKILFKLLQVIRVQDLPGISAVFCVKITMFRNIGPHCVLLAVDIIVRGQVGNNTFPKNSYKALGIYPAEPLKPLFFL